MDVQKQVANKYLEQLSEIKLLRKKMQAATEKLKNIFSEEN